MRASTALGEAPRPQSAVGVHGVVAITPRPQTSGSDSRATGATPRSHTRIIKGATPFPPTSASQQRQCSTRKAEHEFQVPNGELGTCLGGEYTGDYRIMARRVNDGIYVKKLRPNTAGGPLKVDYSYVGRSAQTHPNTTQEATIVYGTRPIGATNTKDYKELSERVQNGLYVKMFGYAPTILLPQIFSTVFAPPPTHTHSQRHCRHTA